MSCYHTFLKAHKLPKDSGLKPTHTRIGDKDLGIFGGSYFIPPEELDTFHELYEEHVIQKKNHEYLTEKQTNEVFVVDLDFRYDTTITSRQHTKENIEQLIKEYVLLIDEYCVLTNKLDVCIMEKPNVNKLEDTTKDGIHI